MRKSNDQNGQYYHTYVVNTTHRNRHGINGTVVIFHIAIIEETMDKTQIAISRSERAKARGVIWIRERVDEFIEESTKILDTEDL